MRLFPFYRFFFGSQFAFLDSLNNFNIFYEFIISIRVVCVVATRDRQAVRQMEDEKMGERGEN
jgi:hypothetical protein